VRDELNIARVSEASPATTTGQDGCENRRNSAHYELGAEAIHSALRIMVRIAAHGTVVRTVVYKCVPRSLLAYLLTKNDSSSLNKTTTALEERYEAACFVVDNSGRMMTQTYVHRDENTLQ
jgi:hypothetical protein